MGGCISDAVGGEELKALKKDVKDLRAALDAAKDALLAVANSINDKVAEVKRMEEAAAALLDGTGATWRSSWRLAVVAQGVDAHGRRRELHARQHCVRQLARGAAPIWCWRSACSRR
jgi:hypothetical protein